MHSTVMQQSVSPTAVAENTLYSCLIFMFPCIVI